VLRRIADALRAEQRMRHGEHAVQLPDVLVRVVPPREGEHAAVGQRPGDELPPEHRAEDVDRVLPGIEVRPELAGEKREDALVALEEALQQVARFDGLLLVAPGDFGGLLHGLLRLDGEVFKVHCA